MTATLQSGSDPQKVKQSKSQHEECNVDFGGSKDFNWWLLFGMMLVFTAGTRFYSVSEPKHVCWDETHFGKMGSWYINRTFFFDVHPPLGKMLIALSGYLTGYDGTFPFEKPGDKFHEVPYVGMRIFCTFLGATIVPLAYLIVWELTKSVRASALSAMFILCDVGLLTLNRYILLDPILLCFMMCATWGMARVGSLQKEPFTNSWWAWMIFTGASLACTMSVKFVGLFVVLLVGIFTVYELWRELGDLTKPVTYVGKHLLARALCLIVLPIVMYMLFFYIHLMVLNKSGSGDGFYSSEFQSLLEGNSLHNATMPRQLSYGATITLKNHRTGGGYLHSHWHLYPEGIGARQQQITTYSHKDDNNVWLVKKFDSDEIPSDPILVKHGDLVRLEHVITRRNLHSHKEIAPISKKHYQVTGYGENGTGDANDVWKILIVNGKDDDVVKTVTSKLKFVHYLHHCALTCSGKTLPKWGYSQQEVSCNPNMRDKNALWNIEDNNYAKLPNVSFQVYAPGFFARLIESHAVMLQGNSDLKVKEGEVTSRPWQWPINYRGQFFSGNNYRIYLLGNPIIWWGNIGFLVLFAVVYLHASVREQRGCEDDPAVASERTKLKDAGSWLFVGWLLHYAPFWAMGRVLYFHHYFPALLYSSMLTGVTLNFIIEGLFFLMPLKIANTLHHALLGAVISATVYRNPYELLACYADHRINDLADNMNKGELALLLTWGLAFHQGLCGELVKVAHQPSNILVDYTAYRHISIIHFKVPENTISALFKFTAKEEKTGGLGNCTPREVSVYLKSGSIPLVQPDGSKISAKLLKDRRYHYSLPITSAGDQYLIRVSTPAPGDWYAIAFRSWTDPDTEQITQQGLAASCETVLEAELFIEPPATLALINDRDQHFVGLNKSRDSACMQFFMDGNSEPVNVSLSSSCGDNCQVAVSITTTETLGGVMMNETKAYLPFRPYAESSFHYLIMRLFSGEASNMSFILPEVNDDFDNRNVRLIALMRKSLPDFFLFDYEHIIGNSTKSSPVNLTVEGITALSFQVGPISDVGGTLSVGIKLVTDRKDVIVFGCVSLGYYSSITAGGSCIRKHSTTAPDLWSRTVDPSMIHVPYPEPGIWYLTLKAFSVTSPCSCLETCQTSVCENCTCLKETSESVEISVGSSPCIEGRCSSNGRCVHYMSGGFVFSACHCTGGYRGFDCADDSYVLTGGGILVRLLMLTLSNLGFIGSVYIAVRREYYTEAIVYTAVMFFSTLYHACEAGEDAHNYCVAKLSILQFCDFFNALLSIWVTLVAMASFGPRLTGFCQVSGAIIIALGSELDRTALWVFLLPAVTGCFLVCTTWSLRCRAKKTFRYPAHPYRNIYLPAGLLIVLLGLICYAFLQTRRNYHIIHSLWHICVAVGVVLLLPPRKSMK